MKNKSIKLIKIFYRILSKNFFFFPKIAFLTSKFLMELDKRLELNKFEIQITQLNKNKVRRPNEF